MPASSVEFSSTSLTWAFTSRESWKTSCILPVLKKGHPRWVQADCTDLSHHEGNGEAGSSTPQTPSVSITGPPTVCMSALCWGWLMMQSSTCCRKPTPSWIDPTPRSLSCSSTSPAPLTPSSPGCWRPNWRTCRWILPLSHGSMTIWQADHSMWDYRTVCLTIWLAKLGVQWYDIKIGFRPQYWQNSWIRDWKN